MENTIHIYTKYKKKGGSLGGGYHIYIYIYGDFPKLGGPFWGPHNKDYSILGVYIGVPLFWETTIYIYTHKHAHIDEVQALECFRNCGHQVGSPA